MSVHATVRVTLEIDAGQGWGDDCTAKQIRKQAMYAAATRLSKILSKDINDVRLIGKIECIHLTYTEDEQETP